jgi:hypothetical protein
MGGFGLTIWLIWLDFYGQEALFCALLTHDEHA